MLSYVLNNKALEDLSRICDYTFEIWSEAQAGKYYYMIIDSREVHIKGDKIEIVRTLHTYMN